MNDDLKPYNGEPKNTTKNAIIEFIETIAIFGVIGLLTINFIARPHRVSGLSMFPNFHDNDYIITNEIGYRLENPQRGQVIVFMYPKDLSEDFIKRIIGLPGNRVKISNGQVFINGTALSEPYLNPSIRTEGGPFLPEDQEITVPQNNYFVLGDNRHNSSDSRTWGFVPKQDIIGQAFLRYWPISSIGLINK